MDSTLRVGPTKSPKLLCRLLGCRPGPGEAIVRVRLRQGINLWQTYSQAQIVTVCRRCRQVRTGITIPALPGDEVDGVWVELQEVH